MITKEMAGRSTSHLVRMNNGLAEQLLLLYKNDPETASRQVGMLPHLGLMIYHQVCRRLEKALIFSKNMIILQK